VNQQIHVTQTNTNRGCLSGCGTTLAVLLLIGIAVRYWYISTAVAVLAVAGGVWYYRAQRIGTPATPLPALSAPCSNCGSSVSGNFCSQCGAAQAHVCSHCGTSGLTTPYCPHCGGATYLPPIST
jgi:hypothetical protein